MLLRASLDPFAIIITAFNIGVKVAIVFCKLKSSRAQLDTV